MIELLIVCALAYVACVVFFMVRTKRSPAGKPTPKRVGRRLPPDELIVKSRQTQRHSQPQATTRAETEKSESKEHTFARDNEKRTSAQIPDEMLDEVFSDSNEIETPQVALTYEEPINYDQEEAEFEGMTEGGVEYAQGVSYEDMDEAVGIAQKEVATDAEKRKAGNTFIQIEGDDLYLTLMRNAEQLQAKIKELMDFSLQAAEPLTVSAEVAEFDIRNFM